MICCIEALWFLLEFVVVVVFGVKPKEWQIDCVLCFIVSASHLRRGNPTTAAAAYMQPILIIAIVAGCLVLLGHCRYLLLQSFSSLQHRMLSLYPASTRQSADVFAVCYRT